jgi:hypothetical protein
MNRNCVYWAIVSLSCALACGFLMQGVYGQGTDMSNYVCLTLTINPQQCNTVGASYCNSLTLCLSSCSYCDSTNALPNTVCAAQEGSTCHENGQAASSCGNSAFMVGKCAIPAGSGCTCTNPKANGSTCGGSFYFPC